jgi:hypothetical protein
LSMTHQRMATWGRCKMVTETKRAVSVGWKIFADVKGNFAQFCKNTGSSEQINVTASIDFWQHVVPSELREKWRQHVQQVDRFSTEDLDLLRDAFEKTWLESKQRLRNRTPQGE